MALGIDAVAACGALDAGGKTVAVLGSGVDHIYPTEHKKLAEHIVKKGLLLSEYPPLEAPTRGSFPTRNRLISGLSQGTLIVEANERSGALITAKDAILQGRDIFALPGNINNPTSNGTNSLIKDGANPITCAADILENYRELYSGVLSFKRLENSQRYSDFNSARAKFYGLDYAIEQNAEKSDKAKDLHPSETEVAAKDKAPEKSEKSTPDASVINSLDEKSRRVYEVICANDAARLDDFVAAGVETGAAMSSLTLLEIRGLISQKPGGFYVKK
jgi:predicted Rossmann fold nucleotide-binding protein DprA/Smf involved in DNA uptake